MLKIICSFTLLLASLAQAQPSLKTVPVPQASGTGQYVQDNATLVVLGKALFWDMQLGSDGRTACATCHFHAGADHRSQNQLSNPNFIFPVNVTLTSADFPFHALADPTNNNSRLLHDNSARFGSAGSFSRQFTAINLVSGDDGYDLATGLAAAFNVNGLNVRQVTVRNAPSVFNAVFNARNFWDGRALNTFALTGSTNASLASQAVGPPTNSSEMSYDGLTWRLLGQRMLALNPLRLQRIAADDSILGLFANPDGSGFASPLTYRTLVESAFASTYWQTAAEDNFQMMFGLALQAYQATLVSDDTPFDRFAAGDTTALNTQEQAGLALFRGRAQCNSCHSGPEFTLASVGNLNRRGGGRNNNNSIGDTGFFRTGVTPLADDIGLTAGAFKTPGLRNVEFTGPYFHNGGQATLEQVVEFYNRGGDFPQGGVNNDIRRLNLNVNERAQLVAFLKALSDDRVRYQRAPFDHPALCVPNGQTDLAQTTDARFSLSADDRMAAIPAIGKSGANAPLQSFAELLDGVGADGSRAHNLTEACPAQ